MVLTKPSPTKRDSAIPQWLCRALCCSQCSQSESSSCWAGSGCCFTQDLHSQSASRGWQQVGQVGFGFKCVNEYTRPKPSLFQALKRNFFPFTWCCWVVTLSLYFLMTRSKSSAGLRIANPNSSLSAEIFVAFAVSAALASPKAVAEVRQELQRGQRIPGSALRLFHFPSSGVPRDAAPLAGILWLLRIHLLSLPW